MGRTQRKFDEMKIAVCVINKKQTQLMNCTIYQFLKCYSQGTVKKQLKHRVSVVNTLKKERSSTFKLTFPPTILQIPSLTSSISETEELSIDNCRGGS